MFGALGGLGAMAAAIIGKPALTRAGVDGDVVLGADNVSAQPTSISVGAQPTSPHVTILGPRPQVSSQHIAVHGSTETEIDGIGVQGTGGLLGIGVNGIAQDGTALMGRSDIRSGWALQTVGRVRLSGHSGVALIPAGRTRVTVSPSGDVGPSSTVTVSPMVNLGGRSLWYTKDTKANTLTFHISAARSSTTRLTWLMLD